MSLFLQHLTYFYSIDGRMKTFLDRIITTYGKMRNKDFYYITTSQDSNRQSLESVFETFHGFAKYFSEIHEKRMNLRYRS